MNKHNYNEDTLVKLRTPERVSFLLNLAMTLIYIVAGILILDWIIGVRKQGINCTAGLYESCIASHGEFKMNNNEIICIVKEK